MSFAVGCLTLWLTAGERLSAEPVAEGSGVALRVEPAELHLESPESSWQLLVSGPADEQVGPADRRGPVGRGAAVDRGDLARSDWTHRVEYRVVDSQVAAVSGGGLVTPRGAGATRVELWVPGGAGPAASVRVVVGDLAAPRPVSFRREVMPILTKAGCNAGGCHGKAEGQNGFKLSVFGYDPLGDHEALVKEARGRRVRVAAPASSLLLTKATARLPHGGGQKFEPGGPWEQRVQRWITEGAALDGPDSPRVVGIEVRPTQVTMRPGATQQLQVTAIDSAGGRRGVTVEAEFRSNAESIATADTRGRIRVGDSAGAAAILVRYMGQVGVCHVTVPQLDVVVRRPPENNFVDGLVWDRLEQLGIQPSELASDATFLRRVYLDTIGTLPTVAESRRFLADASPDKRQRLVAELLERPEYADYWAMRWADLLRADQELITPQGAVGLTRWLRRQYADNVPYDRWVRELLTVQGSTFSESPAAFYQVHKDAESAATALSQLLLGVRIECAQCHHHPFERWSQQDYLAFAGFFSGLKRAKGLVGDQKIVAESARPLKHPRTGLLVPLAPLGQAEQPDEGGGGAIETEPGAAGAAGRRGAAGPAGASAVGASAVVGTPPDPRLQLADWLTAADNPYFARMIANRLWAHYFGRGLVEPIDDLRATNPAVNEPLLAALAEHLVELRFDLKAFTRTLLASRAYQLDAATNASNAGDSQNFSRAAQRALPAEVLLDAICQVTQVSEQFNGWPDGYRAIQVWDNRMPSYFFRVFGKPQRVSVCECERGNEPSMAQALHLMNSPESVHKIRHRHGRAAVLAAGDRSEPQIVEELYLAALARLPEPAEVELMRQAFAESPTRRQAVEDILWALLNSKEFIYNH